MYQTYLAGVSCRKDGFKNCPSDGQPHIHFHSSTDLTLMEAGMFTLDFLATGDHETLGFYRPQPIPEKDRFKRGAQFTTPESPKATRFFVFDFKKLKALIDGPDCADPSIQCHDPLTCPSCQTAEFMATHSPCRTTPIQEHYRQHDEWVRGRVQEELTAKKLLQDVAAYARGMAPLTEEVKSVIGPFMNTERDLRNLLAVIHRDGGHYVENVGMNAAVEDAMKIVSNLLVVEDAWKAEKLPLLFVEQSCNRTKDTEPMKPDNDVCELCIVGSPCYRFFCTTKKTTPTEGVFVPKSNTPQFVIGDTIIPLDGLKLAQEDEISRLRGRIDELFAYNNEQVERRRAAENRVKELEAKLLSGDEKKKPDVVRLAPVCSTERCARQPGPEARIFYHGYCCGICFESDANKHTPECERRWQAHLDTDDSYPFPRLRNLDTILKRPTRPCLFKEKYGCTEITEYPYAWACDPCWQRYKSEDDSPAPQAVESAEDQVKRLGIFIMENVPGEPSQSEGAVDTAIRVLQSLLTTMGVYAEDIFSLVRRRNEPTEAAAEPTTCTVDVWDNMDARSNPCGQPLPCSFHGPKKTKAAEIRDFASIIMENGLLGDLAEGLEKTEYKGRSMTDRLREKMEEAGVHMRLGPARISTRIQTWPQVEEWNNPNACGQCTLKKGDDYPDEPSISYRFTFVARDGRGWFVRGYYCNDCYKKLIKNPEVGVPSTVTGSAASAGGDSDDVPLLSSSDESRPSGAYASISEQMCESVRSTRG